MLGKGSMKSMFHDRRENEAVVEEDWVDAGGSFGASTASQCCFGEE